MQKLFVPILIFSLSFLFCNSYVALGGVPVGDWRPVNPSDPSVIEIGKFAVDEHNKEANTALRYINVVNGKSQLEVGVKYNLTIQAADGTFGKNYQAVVRDMPWRKSRVLLSFEGPI
ncbi:Cystatin [Artemisia annua]|uniref:Cystatin n=1 Tax=Artemisia annua TaxID=35608 RepID=A0A2U1NWL5_ARTAN|nr:Cystatin [Artemisia annua]